MDKEAFGKEFCILATLRLRGGNVYREGVSTNRLCYGGDLCVNMFCDDGCALGNILSRMVKDSDYEFGMFHLEPR